MRQTRLRTAAAIIAAIVLLGFLISAPRTSEAPEALEATATETVVPTVTLRDSYKKGTHTITGSLVVPNACASVAASATHAAAEASTTESIVVEVTLTSGEGTCLEVPTMLTFSTTVAAPQGLPLIATVNGAPASTTSP